MSKLKRKKNIPFHKRRYYDFKKPSFPDAIPPSNFSNAIKLERFIKKAEQNNTGYIIIVRADNKMYSIEWQELVFDEMIKRENSGFVDIEPTEYFKNNERQINMTGSYFHGFHYFENEDDAKYVADLLYKYFETEIKPIFLMSNNASGEMFGVKANVSAEIMVWK
jgi:hypothetical protein